MLRQRMNQVAEEFLLLALRYVLEYIEAVNAVEPSAHGPFQQIVLKAFDRPARIRPAFGIIDEALIEVDGGQTLDRLPHDATDESVAATRFQYVLTAREH